MGIVSSKNSQTLYLQVAPKVAGIEARDGQAITVSCQHSRAVLSLIRVVQLWQRRLCCGVQVRPDARQP